MKKGKTSQAKDRQAGYALLMVMFFVALLVLATAAAAPSVLTQVRREKEQQMIWRGKQYALGVQRYYTKLHRFPTSLDDLYKPKTGIRFMRQAYKDPTNKEDGAWRLIYVGPNGQLIGSLKTQAPNLNGGGSPSSFGGMFGAQSSVGGMAGGSQGPSSSSIFSSPGTNAANPPAAVPSGTTQSTDTSGAASTDQAPTYTDTSNIVGGNIIGVGGKVNQKSIIWYDKARDYRHFEFIWDPSVDQLTGQRVGQIPPNPGTNVTNQQGSGTNSNQTNPNQNPGAPPMNPPPTPPEQ
jgi:type II secretory pathway pseudopilin PulG